MPLSLELLRQVLYQTPSEAWRTVLGAAWETCTQPLPSDRPAAGETMRRERELAALDLYLATAGYDLWKEMETSAPRNTTALAEWWTRGSPGRAVLILDGLSLREVPWILQSARAQGYIVSTAQPHVSEIPSETTPFARALGFAQRSALEANGAGNGHAFPGAKTESLGIPWAEAAKLVPPYPDVILWHHWPDSRFQGPGAANLEGLTKEAREQLESKDFWYLIHLLTTGRRLVITSDHGYAATGQFLNTEDEDQATYLQQIFKKGRRADGGPAGPWSPPLDLRMRSTHGDHRMVLGRRKWKVPSGYSALTHGGLSVLEVAVPFIELSRP